ncbi:hypothetical protein [Streptomyces yaizuensis]|uniref:Uncharacterized protein n=1 Tax=Streptomyces yaizuensis TaxID=2989713 RepID=A0ABQ5P6H5_9ACTN|nr:hypothetical protein [Streptomyces sp. YSPA8]GLF98185.1 hypothetical protein SYYSPA8_27830 [Streptomyces sp. YSPA8]
MTSGIALPQLTGAQHDGKPYDPLIGETLGHAQHGARYDGSW